MKACNETAFLCCYFIPALIEQWKSVRIDKEYINLDKLEDEEMEA